MAKAITNGILFLLLSTVSMAQTGEGRVFHSYLVNTEYGVYLRLNLYDQDVKVPGHELYGELPGFLGKENNSFCWLITSCQVKDGQHATLQLINDYGSEDLQASLTCVSDSVYVLRQQKGSTIKVPHKGKWLKLPKTLEFKRK